MFFQFTIKCSSPIPTYFCLNLPFLLFLKFSQYCFSLPRCIITVISAIKSYCLIHLLQSVACFVFKCIITLFLLCPVVHNFCIWFTPVCLHFECLLCIICMFYFKCASAWFEIKTLVFSTSRFTNLLHGSRFLLYLYYFIAIVVVDTGMLLHNVLFSNGLGFSIRMPYKNAVHKWFFLALFLSRLSY